MKLRFPSNIDENNKGFQLSMHNQPCGRWTTGSLSFLTRFCTNTIRNAIEHVQETLQLLSVMAGDQRFKEAYNSANGGVKNICEVLDRIEVKGKAEGEIIGEAKGRAEGKAEGGLNMLIGLVKDGLLSIEVAAQRANKSIEEFQKLVDKAQESEDTSF